MKRKKVLFMSDFVLARTGFGKNARNIIEYLYKKDTYDIVHYSVGSVMNNPELERTPWKSIGCVNPQQVQSLKQQNDPKNWDSIERMAGYGQYALDDIIKQEKPDVFIACQDIWGIDFSVEKGWFNKVSSVLWTTLDSLPILPKAVELASKVKNFWSWAEFATKALHADGHKHVKTVRGAVDVKHFFRHSDQKRSELRKRFQIPDKSFIIGFVFRNQLRKSVPNLLQGFKEFQRDNPSAQAKLLLHTSWQEGWDIPSFLKEYKIKNEDILTTHVCRNCGHFDVRPFTGTETNCRICNAEKAAVTTHPAFGINESQLNDVYNLMDVYCHPFTSGGQEIPIQEAKLTELVTLVTNYSCGEDSCAPEAGSLALDWSEYREPGTQFIKASTFPSSISKQLKKVFDLKETARRELGKKGRKWVIDNFSVEVIGKVLEDFIDASPLVEVDLEDKFEARNPFCEIPNIADNTEWLIFMYENILKMRSKDENGIKYWLGELGKGAERASIEKYFREVAMKENGQHHQVSFDDFLNKDDKGRVILVQPESAGDILLCTALFQSIKERYPDWTFYVSTKKEYKSLIDGNPYVDKWIEYNTMMDNLLWLEGHASHKGFFDVAYLPYIQTQKITNPTHNAVDKIDLTLS